MDTASINALLAHLDPEVWVVTAAAGARRGGLVATSVAPASIVPEMPRTNVAVARQHHTAELIETAGAFALHLLGEEQLDWVWRFGLQSGRDRDKLAGLRWRGGITGSPILAGVVGWFECRVEARLDTGDRYLYLGEVLDGALEATRPALRWQRAVALAAPDQLAELKARRERQAASDADLIRAWRQLNCG